MIILKVYQELYKDIDYYNSKDNEFYQFKNEREDSGLVIEDIAERIKAISGNDNKEDNTKLLKEYLEGKILSVNNKIIVTLAFGKDSWIFKSSIKVLTDLFGTVIDKESFEEYRDMYDEMHKVFSEDIYSNDGNTDSGINKYIKMEDFLNKFNKYSEPLNAYLKIKYFEKNPELEENLEDFLEKEFIDIFCIVDKNGKNILPILCDVPSVMLGRGDFYNNLTIMTSRTQSDNNFIDKITEDESNNYKPVDPEDEYKLEENEAIVRDKNGNIKFILRGMYNEDMDDVSISVKKL